MKTQSDTPVLFPQHKVCETKVGVPTVRLEHWEQKSDEDPPARDVLVVQWYGDNDRQELAGRNLQFAFPLMCRPDAPQWFGHPEWYRTVMIGRLNNWPNEQGLAAFLKSGMSRDDIVLYVVTSNIGLDDGKGGVRASAFIVPVIQLGDPVFGVITPREYADWSVAREENEKLKK